MLPMALAAITTKTRVRQTVSATGTVTAAFPKSSRSTSISLTKLHTASPTPHKTATRISFHTIQGRSEKEISPREMLRIMATDAWEPELPPVPMSMGINAVSTA